MHGVGIESFFQYGWVHELHLKGGWIEWLTGIYCYHFKLGQIKNRCLANYFDWLTTLFLPTFFNHDDYYTCCFCCCISAFLKCLPPWGCNYIWIYTASAMIWVKQLLHLSPILHPSSAALPKAKKNNNKGIFIFWKSSLNNFGQKNQSTWKCLKLKLRFKMAKFCFPIWFLNCRWLEIADSATVKPDQIENAHHGIFSTSRWLSEHGDCQSALGHGSSKHWVRPITMTTDFDDDDVSKNSFDRKNHHALNR